MCRCDSDPRRGARGHGRRRAGPGRGPIPLLVALGLLAATPVAADVVVDGRLQGAPDTTLVGSDVDIPAELGKLEGENLFHAFRRFGVAPGGSTTFLGPLGGEDVARVISLVTGCASGCDAATRIDGRLALAPEIRAADLFLIDPNGVIFGEGARLDVGGAFTVGTAHAIELADGGLFLASDPGSPASTLTSAPPSAFGFLEPPAPVEVDGAQLEAPGGLALLGGDLAVDGTRADAGFGFLATGAARVDLVSLASAGRVALDPGSGAAPDVAASALGRIELQGGAVISSSGLSPGAPLGRPVPAVPAPGAGDVFIRGGELVIEGGSRVQAFTTTYTRGGDIDVELSGDLVVRGLDSGLFAGSGLVLDPDFEGTTRVRDIVPVADGGFPFIEVERIFDGPPAEIASRCVPGACRVSYGGFGAFDGDPSTGEPLGAAGDVRVQARDVLVLAGGKISNTSFFGGDGGAITIEAERGVTLTGAPDLFAGTFDAIRGGLFSNAEGGGNAGRIEVAAETLEIDGFGAIVTELRGGEGRGGDIDVAVDGLRIAGNGRIDTSTRGDGSGGSIRIAAAEEIGIAGALDADEFSGVTSLSQPEATGDAGSIRIEAPAIRLEDGARISTRAFGGGDAGTVDIRFGDRLRVKRGTISAEAFGAFGGDIYLNGGPIRVRPDGSLEIETPSDLGPIGRDLRIIDGEISTSVASGVGSGGNIAIQSEQAVLVRSAVTADADVSNGGNIRIVASRFAPDDRSIVRASSNLGEDGLVEIETLGAVLIPPLVDLPARFLDATELLREPCTTRAPETPGASLVVEGTDGVPAGPEDYLPSRIPLGSGGEDDTGDASEGESPGAAGRRGRSESRAETGVTEGPGAKWAAIGSPGSAPRPCRIPGS